MSVPSTVVNAMRLMGNATADLPAHVARESPTDSGSVQHPGIQLTQGQANGAPVQGILWGGGNQLLKQNSSEVEGPAPPTAPSAPQRDKPQDIVSALMANQGIHLDSTWPQTMGEQQLQQLEQQQEQQQQHPHQHQKHQQVQQQRQNSPTQFDIETALDRVSIKMHGVTPDDLPPDLRARLSAWIRSADAEILQVNGWRVDRSEVEGGRGW